MDIEFILASSQGVLADSTISTHMYSLSDLIAGTPQKSLEIPEAYQGVLSRNPTILLTNTFDADRLCLSLIGHEQDCTAVNRRAAQWLRRATEPYRSHVVIAGSIGFNGCFASMETLVSIYTEQAQALFDGGVDCFWLESFPSLETVTAAVTACRHVAPEHPIIAMIAADPTSFDPSFDPLNIAFHLQQQGVTAIGIDINQLNQLVSVEATEDALTVLDFFMPDVKLGAMINAYALDSTDVPIEQTLCDIVREVKQSGVQIVGLGQGGNATYLSLLADMMAETVALPSSLQHQFSMN